MRLQEKECWPHSKTKQVTLVDRFQLVSCVNQSRSQHSLFPFLLYVSSFIPLAFPAFPYARILKNIQQPLKLYGRPPLFEEPPMFIIHWAYFWENMVVSTRHPQRCQLTSSITTLLQLFRKEQCYWSQYTWRSCWHFIQGEAEMEKKMSHWSEEYNL